jgi:hypothetical protein
MTPTRPFPHTYEVEVQTDTGDVVTTTVTSRHNPDHALTPETIRTAARCQVWMASGRRAPFPQHAGDPQLIEA